VIPKNESLATLSEIKSNWDRSEGVRALIVNSPAKIEFETPIIRELSSAGALLAELNN